MLQIPLTIIDLQNDFNKLVAKQWEIIISVPMSYTSLWDKKTESRPAGAFWAVSFSPAPECVEVLCWNLGFSTPPCHQSAVVVLLGVSELRNLPFGSHLGTISYFFFCILKSPSSVLRKFLKWNAIACELYYTKFMYYCKPFYKIFQKIGPCGHIRGALLQNIPKFRPLRAY